MFYTITKLSDHPYAQATIEKHLDGSVVFISYATPVIRVSPKGWMTCTGTYSQTTRRQIGWFLKEYFPMVNYQTAKLLYTDGYAMNVRTGELRKIK